MNGSVPERTPGTTTTAFPLELTVELENASEVFDAFQLEALRSAGDATSGTGGLPPLVYLSMGLCGESGELIDHIKKRMRDGVEIDKDDVVEELGDILWYVAVLSQQMGFSLSLVAARNVQKLRERYPEGFDAERSINRPHRDAHKAYNK